MGHLPSSELGMLLTVVHCFCCYLSFRGLIGKGENKKENRRGPSKLLWYIGIKKKKNKNKTTKKKTNIAVSGRKLFNLAKIDGITEAQI